MSSQRASRPPRGLRALGEQIAHEEDALLARPLPAEQAFLRAPRPKRRRPAVRAAAALAASFALVAAGAATVAHLRPLTLTVGGEAPAPDGWISAPANGTVPLRFSEGTEIELDPETHARVTEVTRRGAHVILESGTALVSVTPNGGGKWTFTAGPFQVDVKGTRFEVAWSPGAQVFSLKLVEGSVFISGCALGDGHPLFAGETLRASCLDREFRIETASSSSPAPLPRAAMAEPPAATDPELDASELGTRLGADVAPRGLTAHAARGGVRDERDETWQSLARASRFKEAFARASERGFEAELARANRDDLLLLGEVARLSGDSEKALLAYQRVRTRAPGSDAAANAAFEMGRVYFDQRQAYREAASWFATYRSERSGGALARDATGRQMEALSRAGDAEAAARVAGEYLRAYPKGPHASLARTLGSEAN